MKKIIQKILLHLTIILIVTIFPVIVYEFMADHQYNDFEFIGGISYFIYAFYLILKFKNRQAKIILLGIFCALLAFFTGIIFIDINVYILLTLLIINLLFQTFLLIKNPKSKNRAVWIAYLINFAITVMLSVFFSFILFLAIAASAMPSNHY